MATTDPAVTPRMAPAAPMSTPSPALTKYQARRRPTTNLKAASMTWEMAEGIMLPCPWV